MVWVLALARIGELQSYWEECRTFCWRQPPVWGRLWQRTCLAVARSVRDGRNGLLALPRDARVLAEAIGHWFGTRQCESV